LSYSVAFLAAATVFVVPWLIAARKEPRLFPRIPLLPVLVGSAAGGALAGAIGIGIGFSVPLEVVMAFFGIQDRLPEPMLSVGIILGAAVSALAVLSLLDHVAHSGADARSTETMTYSTPMVAAASALAGRLLAALIDLLSLPPIATFRSGTTALFLDPIAGGALCGYLMSRAFTRRRAA
jgi:hypothetical protein